MVIPRQAIGSFNDPPINTLSEITIILSVCATILGVLLCTCFWIFICTWIKHSDEYETNRYGYTIQPTLTSRTIYDENAKHGPNTRTSLEDTRTRTREDRIPLISAAPAATTKSTLYSYMYDRYNANSDTANNSTVMIDLPPSYNAEEVVSNTQAFVEQNMLQEPNQEHTDTAT